MTLCLAWKQGKEVYFASDSRLTDGVSPITNDATKIFKIGVEIYGQANSGEPAKQESLLFQTTFGLCFTGSYLNGSLLADTVEEVFSNLQGAQGYSDFSIDNLADIAFLIYKQVSKQLTGIVREKGTVEVLFGGYCLVNNDFKLYKFYPKPLTLSNELLEYEKEEVNLNGQVVFIGEASAKKKAGELLKNINDQYSHFHLLRDIIIDTDIPAVGGNIQAGLFSHTKFETYGVVEYSTFEDDYGIPRVKDSYKFRGIFLDEKELMKGNLSIRKKLFDPFEHERKELFNKTFESIKDIYPTKNEGNKNDI